MDNNPLIEIVADIRLAPVADPPNKLTGGYPLFDVMLISRRSPIL
jgi:hypothetical protein